MLQRFSAIAILCVLLTASAAAAPAAMKDKYAKVNGIRLHYVTAGKGPLILCLHGFPEFWYEWKNQLAALSDHYQIVAPDMRGYNLSDKPASVDQYKVNLLVEDVRALSEHLAHGKKFVLVAHDWGGAVAWAFAAAHPELLEKLVIINAPHPAVFARLLAHDPAQQKASAYMLTFRNEQAEAMLSANNYALLVGVVLGDGLKNGFFSAQDKAEYIKAWSQPGALTGGLNYYRAARIGPPTPGDTPSGFVSIDPAKLIVRVPTLVIWGEKDTALTVGNLDGLDKFVPDLTIKKFPDATHWVVHEKAAEVNAAIRAFVSGK